jgi:hypothetical protein
MRLGVSITATSTMNTFSTKGSRPTPVGCLRPQQFDVLGLGISLAQYR